MRKFRTNPGHHDTNPMLHLRARHGAAGYGVYIMLINLIASSPTRSIEADAAFLAYALRADEALVKSVLFDFDLFTISPDGHTASSPLVTPPQPKKPAQAPQPPKGGDAVDYTPSDATRAADAVPMPMFQDFNEIIRRNKSLHPSGFKDEYDCQRLLRQYPVSKEYDKSLLAYIMSGMWIFFATKGITGLGIDYILHRAKQYHIDVRSGKLSD